MKKVIIHVCGSADSMDVLARRHAATNQAVACIADVQLWTQHGCVRHWAGKRAPLRA